MPWRVKEVEVTTVIGGGGVCLCVCVCVSILKSSLLWLQVMMYVPRSEVVKKG